MFAIGGTHDLNKFTEIRKKLIAFLQEEDHVILSDDEENIRWAKAAINYIDASIVYAEKTCSKAAYPYVKAFLLRMMATDLVDWYYDELRLFIGSIHFTNNIEQANEFFKQANEKCIQFKRLRPTPHLEAALVANVSARILNAKHFDENVTVDLADTFASKFMWLEDLIEKNHDSQYSQYLAMLFQVMKVRQAIFNQDQKAAFVLCEGLAQYSEQLREAIYSEVDFYLIEGFLK